MLLEHYFKIISSFIFLIYPVVEFTVAIVYRKDIIFNTDYSINISNWLITKDIFILINTGILMFYFLSNRVSVFVYCISQGFVYFCNLFTFVWTSIGLIIYANQFELGDFDTPIVFFGVVGGYICLWNLYVLNKMVNNILEENKTRPLLDF